VAAGQVKHWHVSCMSCNSDKPKGTNACSLACRAAAQLFNARYACSPLAALASVLHLLHRQYTTQQKQSGATSTCRKAASAVAVQELLAGQWPHWSRVAAACGTAAAADVVPCCVQDSGCACTSDKPACRRAALAAAAVVVKSHIWSAAVELVPQLLSGH
jgi:hypothetical protein